MTELHLLQGLFIPHHDLGYGARHGLGKRSARCREMVEVRDEIDESIVLQVSRGRNNHIRAGEALAIVVKEGLLLEAPNRLFVPRMGLPKG